jgi:FtsP/CotA-like multicopper oxidase with cupredoxin domain
MIRQAGADRPVQEEVSAMKENIGLSRRGFLRLTGAGALATTIPHWLLAAENAGRFVRKPTPGFHADVEIEITAGHDTAPILPGKPTSCWKYTAKVVKGDSNAVAQLPGTHLSSVLRFHRGDKVHIFFLNDLPEPNIIHWHGLHVPQIMDGHPMYEVASGKGYLYEFQVNNRAGTYFYHAHTHELTGHHVYKGLGGLLIVHDEEEKALGLPSGELDIPVVIQDRNFDADNQFKYVQNMRDRHMGLLGDEILVNGKRNFVLPVATRAYRLRLVNASNSRVYKLGWEDGSAFTVIATDGGLLEKPVTRPYLMLGPGERYDVFADFSGRKVGSELVLKSLPFTGALPGHEGGGMGMMDHGEGERGGMGRMEHGEDRGERRGGPGGGRMGMMRHGGGEGRSERGPGMGMMEHEGEDHRGGRGMMGMMGHGEEGGERRGPGGGMMMHASAIPMGSDYPLLKIQVTREESSTHKLPERLSKSFERYRKEQADNRDKPRTIRISMMRMKWLLNGRDFEMTASTPEETIPVNTLQLIEFDNGYSGEGHGMMGGMMGMVHPMHIHGQQFQIIERVVREDHKQSYESVREGYVDEGYKDVALVMPGEKVTLLKRFDDYKGLFLYHCHNLEHEEMGMMRNFNVV